MRNKFYQSILRCFTCIVFLIITDSVFAQNEKEANKPNQKLFDLNPDNLDVLENSVNLFTGQVSFPMNLVSLPGRGGLDLSVNILYNSIGIPYKADTWNAEAPTGIVGLGWTMDVPKIVCDHKQTGARADDDFYLVENGQSIKLICIDAEAYPRQYVPEKKLLWKVEYSDIQEQWTVIKENGLKFVFGNKNSGRGTVQWVVKWGNWIGNSTQPSGQEQMAYIWNISEVENLWGEKLTFTYDNDEEFVAKDINTITSEKKHTKASYLKKIEEPSGKSVEFLYGEKTYLSNEIREYQDPHMEQDEPDAYQEKYETRYLDRLIVRNEGGRLLYETDLGYTITGEGDKAKRLLTSIKKIYPTGASLPPVRFEYFTAGDFKGSLRKVINSYGAFYEYTYQKRELPLSKLDLDIEMPTASGWKEHYTYIGNNYVLVVWRTVNSDGSHNSGFRPCRIWLYTWDGMWHSELLNDQNINIKTRENAQGKRVLDWQIVLGDNFFAYLYEDDNGSGYDGKIYHRNEQMGAVWRLQSIGTGDDNPVLLKGNDFVAWCGLNGEVISTYIFNGEYGRFADIDIDEHYSECFFSAANNYIFVHNDNSGGQDYIYVFYLDEEKRWQKSAAASDQLFETDGDGEFRRSNWYSFNSFTTGFVWDNEEYIYQWDENYGAITKKRGWGGWDDDSYVYGRYNALLGVAEKKGDGRTTRYDGSIWQFTENYYGWSYRDISFGNDFYIVRYVTPDPTYPYKYNIRTYDPNAPGWPRAYMGYKHYTPRLNTHNGVDGLPIEAGANLFVIGDGDVYQRDFAGRWNYFYQLATGNEFLMGKSVALTPTFIAYESSSGKTSESANGSFIVTLKNGQIDKTLRFPGSTFDNKRSHVGAGIVVHVLSDTKLKLRKIINGKAEGFLPVNSISVLQWYDGNRMFYNSYDYDLSTAKADPGGLTAYFNKVSVIPGSRDIAYRPFGHTDYYFINGLAFDELAREPLNLYFFEYNIPLGKIYETNIISAAKDTVAYMRSGFRVFRSQISNSEDEQVGLNKYIRLTDVYRKADSIETTTAHTYDDATGLLKSTKSWNSSGTGHSEMQRRKLIYWREIYDPEGGSQNIHQPVQMINIRSSGADADTTASAVTRWRTWGPGKWAPDKTYRWLRKNSGTFSAWEYPSEPSISEWKTVNHILEREPSTGVVLETINASEIVRSVIYDQTKTRPFATVVNAGIHEIAYTGFEDQSPGNWVYQPDSVVSSDAATGVKAFYAASAEISSGDLPPGDYTVSYWAKGNVPQVTINNGTLLAGKSYMKPNNWTLHVNKVRIDSSYGTVRLQVQGLIDELRLHPENAQMSTFAYNRYGSAICETSARHLITRYEYDNQNRLFLVRDHEDNIVKRYSYRYRDEDEYFSALLTWADSAKAGHDIEFTLHYPGDDADSALYSWSFGDGMQLVTDTPSVIHAYKKTGFYQVRVKVEYPNSGVAGGDDKVINVIKGDMEVSISGVTEAYVCQGTQDSEVLTYSAEISGGCEEYTYKWYVRQGNSETFAGAGSQLAYSFEEVGYYEIYCEVTDGCGKVIQSDFLEVSIYPDVTNSCDPFQE